MVKPKIAPSMLSSDFANLASEAERMIRCGADWLHMDIMDGHFVPNLTIGAPVIESLRKYTQAYLDCHLMVTNPIDYVEPLAKAGASGFTFHVEVSKDNWQELVQKIKSKGMKPGVSLKPRTPVEEVYPLLEGESPVEMVLVMTVEPGFGGQKFMPEMMDKVCVLRKKYPSLDIEVDGGLGPSTIDLAASAGANCIVAGSSIFGAPDPAQVISLLHKTVENAQKKANNVAGIVCNCSNGGFLEADVIKGQINYKKREITNMWMIEDYIATGAAGILLIITIVATIFFFKNRGKMKRQNSIKNDADSELQRLSLSFRTATDNKVSFDGSHYNFEDSITADSSAPHKNLVGNYTFEEIQKATSHFSSSNLIEGSVYQGRLNGEGVAIKSVSTEIISRIDHQRFIHHPNIIKVLGTCVMDGHDSFIVLEYASNGCLKDWIHGGLAMKNQFIASCNRFLNWNQRLKICLDAANALQFFHNAMNLYHVRLSMRNIFLDEEFNPKIGCLGFTLSLEHKNEEAYLAPEYVRESAVSPSLDVFAFGVVVLEVLSGRPPLKISGERLSDEIKMVLRSENAEELREWMDGRLGERYSFDGAVKVVNLARSCVEDDAAARPSAGEIATKLLSLVEELAAEG